MKFTTTTVAAIAGIAALLSNNFPQVGGQHFIESGGAASRRQLYGYSATHDHSKEVRACVNSAKKVPEAIATVSASFQGMEETETVTALIDFGTVKASGMESFLFDFTASTVSFISSFRIPSVPSKSGSAETSAFAAIKMVPKYGGATCYPEPKIKIPLAADFLDWTQVDGRRDDLFFEMYGFDKTSTARFLFPKVPKGIYNVVIKVELKAEALDRRWTSEEARMKLGPHIVVMERVKAINMECAVKYDVDEDSEFPDRPKEMPIEFIRKREQMRLGEMAQELGEVKRVENATANGGED